MNRLREALQQLKKTFENRPKPSHEPRYDCLWCKDTGMVECYKENGENHPIHSTNRLQVLREKRSCYLAVVPCGFCEAGTRRGRPTEGTIKAAERWAKENITTIVSMRGTYEKAQEEGYSEAMIDQACQRLGIRKKKIAGRWVFEPPQ